MNTRARVASAALAGMLWAPGVLADWTAHADFSACPRKYYPNLSGKEAPVATEAECKAQIDRAKRGDSAVCIRYSCIEGAGGGGAARAAPGHELDKNIEQAISAGLSGQISGTDAAALVGVGVLGNILLAGMSPEQQQQRQQQAEAERRQAAEQARQRDAAEEQRKDRLLGEMQGVDHSSDLGLMTDDTEPQLMTGDAGTGGELALMTDDDDTRGIMGKRKAPAPKRNRPPATRVNPGPYNTPVSGSAPSRGSPGDGANGQPPPEPEMRGPTDRESLAEGFEDGNACRQRLAGAHCRVLRGEALGNCLRSYNRGFDAGEAELRRNLEARGAAAAAADRGRGRTPTPTPFNHAESRGPCGNIFVQAYNNAFP